MYISSSVLHIVELLMVNRALEALHIGGNDIGDDGIAGIADVLNKTNINKLYVSKCGISLVGAKLLAATLLDNKNLKLLVIQGNRLTLEGAHLILQSAVDNKVCQVVLVDKEYEDDDEVSKMITILKNRKRQQVAIATVVMV